jgi:hypothetical protein
MGPRDTRGITLAIDIGGTFTDAVFDLKGQMLAQAVTGTPGHINSMALSVGHFLERSPWPPWARATATSRTTRGRARAI